MTFPFEAVITEPLEIGPSKWEEKIYILGLEGVDDFYGVLVQVSKEGYENIVPLYDLEVEQEDLPQYQPIDDYLTWIMNR